MRINKVGLEFLNNKKSGLPTPDALRKGILKKYAEISISAEGKFEYSTGKKGAIALGYAMSMVEGMPGELVESFCGVGNPFKLGPVNKGEAVLDIGCGAGFDLVVAGCMVGPDGRVCGIDLTPEMADKAAANLKNAGIPNREVRVSGAEDMPYGDGTFDVVISNGVLNLSPRKEQCFKEIYRVLKPGGRLQFADVVLKDDVQEGLACTIESWTD